MADRLMATIDKLEAERRMVREALAHARQVLETNTERYEAINTQLTRARLWLAEATDNECADLSARIGAVRQAGFVPAASATSTGLDWKGFRVAPGAQAWTPPSRPPSQERGPRRPPRDR